MTIGVLVKVGVTVWVKDAVGVFETVAVKASVVVEVGLLVKVEVAVAETGGGGDVGLLKCLVQLVSATPTSRSPKIAIQDNFPIMLSPVETSSLIGFRGNSTSVMSAKL